MSFIANLNKAFRNTASIFNGLALLDTRKHQYCMVRSDIGPLI